MKSLKLELLFLFSITILNKSWTYLVNPNSSYRIMGGIDVNVHQPFMVSIEKDGIHDCGGTIVNERTVLTAAHCFHGWSITNTMVHAGDRTLSVINGAKYKVAAMFFHPLFNPFSLHYDVGLVRVKTPFTFNDKVQPIELSTYLRHFTSGTIFGWGYMGPNPPLSEMLKMAEVFVLSDITCNAYHPSLLTSTMFCAGYLEGGIDACTFDSGGPFVRNGQQVGIISSGKKDCGQPNSPGIYTIVAKVRGWVQDFLMERYNETIL